jgi:hypothetical protein
MIYVRDRSAQKRADAGRRLLASSEQLRSLYGQAAILEQISTAEPGPAQQG